MMATVRITSSCLPAPSDAQILLPKAVGRLSSSRVVVTLGGQQRVLSAGIRGDEGLGACVSGSVLQAAGGTEIEWREGHWYDVYRYDRAKLLAGLVALLALAASVTLAMLAFIVNSSSTDAATKTTAGAVLVLTILTAVITFVQGMSLST